MFHYASAHWAGDYGGSDDVGSAAYSTCRDAVVASADGKTLYLACGTGNQVLGWDIESRKISSIAVPLAPSGLAVSRDDSMLYVTCGGAESCVYTLTLKRGGGRGKSGDGTGKGEGGRWKIEDGRWDSSGTIRVGHTATAPAISADGRTLYVCNRFDNDVSVIDLGLGETPRGGTRPTAPAKEECRIPVQREPVAADITKDGKYLLVANQLPSGRADVETVAAVVSVIDLAERKVVQEL